MIRKHNLGFNQGLRLRFAAATLFIIACSATAEDPIVPVAGAPNLPASGGTGGSGVGAGTGGTPAFPPGTGGSIPAATAGQPTAVGGSAGGTPAVSGGGVGGKIIIPGAVSGAAGAPPAAVAGMTSTGAAGSGTTSADCDTYKGTVAADSLIFKSGYGTATGGTWKGYSYTYKFPKTSAGPKITPDFDASPKGCFKGAKVCVEGTIPASDSAGVGIGWNIAQESSSVGTVAVTTGVKVTLQGKVMPAGMRVALNTGSDEFCAPLTGATGGTVALTAFKTECWGDEGTAYAGEPVESIQVSVPGSATNGPTTFDFCIIDIEPAP